MSSGTLSRVNMDWNDKKPFLKSLPTSSLQVRAYNVGPSTSASIRWSSARREQLLFWPLPTLQLLGEISLAFCRQFRARNLVGILGNVLTCRKRPKDSGKFRSIFCELKKDSGGDSVLQRCRTDALSPKKEPPKNAQFSGLKRDECNNWSLFHTHRPPRIASNNKNRVSQNPTLLSTTVYQKGKCDGDKLSCDGIRPSRAEGVGGPG